MKGKLAGLLLFLCLIVPIAATYTFLHYRKMYIKKEVKQQIIAGIDKEELVLLIFTKEEAQTKLRWEHSHEFEYNGQMYDIVEMEISGDTIYYHCWWDYKETKLNKKLYELLAYAMGNDGKKKESQQRLTNFYTSLFHSINDAWKPLYLISEINPCIYYFYYSSVSFPPPNPPPQLS